VACDGLGKEVLPAGLWVRNDLANVGILGENRRPEIDDAVVLTPDHVHHERLIAKAVVKQKLHVVAVLVFVCRFVKEAVRRPEVPASRVAPGVKDDQRVLGQKGFDGRVALAVAMTQKPLEVPDELFAELQRHLNARQLVELTSAIAWENYRARFDHALGIEAECFSEGAVCAVPVGGAHRA